MRAITISVSCCSEWHTLDLFTTGCIRTLADSCGRMSLEACGISGWRHMNALNRAGELGAFCWVTSHVNVLNYTIHYCSIYLVLTVSVSLLHLCFIRGRTSTYIPHFLQGSKVIVFYHPPFCMRTLCVLHLGHSGCGKVMRLD